MCSPENIKLQNLLLGPVKVLVAVYILYVGCVICDTVELHRAYGEYFIEAGAGLIMLGLISGFMVVPSFAYGLKRHNRFVIISCFVMDTIIMSMLLHLGATMGEYLIPLYSKDLQENCLRSTPTLDYEVCRDYLESDRTAAFRLVWAGFFTDKAIAQQYQVLSTLQEANGCCGFYPPLNCDPITSRFPRDRPTDGIAGSLASQRLICGPVDLYYPVQDNCEDYSQLEPPQIIGGCRYDLAVGDNCLNALPLSESMGCASNMEDYVANLISMHVYVLFTLCPLFSFMGMVLSCCMYWKRKEHRDVFPPITAQVHHTFDYQKVKDQFEVVPKRDLLKKAGFYPPEKKYDDENKEGALVGEGAGDKV
jgi:hypothetical protein